MTKHFKKKTTTANNKNFVSVVNSNKINALGGPRMTLTNEERRKYKLNAIRGVTIKTEIGNSYFVRSRKRTATAGENVVSSAADKTSISEATK